MGKLRKTIQRQVIDTLDASIFTAEDFTIYFGDPENNEHLISLVFKHNQDYLYQVSANHSSHYNPNNYILTKSPGKTEDVESTYENSLDGLILNMPAWCQEIRNELKATIPIFREMDELKNAFYEHLKGHGNSEEFTAAEINKLKEKFEELNRRVDELEKGNVITESQSHEFTTGMEKITDDLEYYPKETWLKTASNKIAKLIANLGKSPEGRKIIADSARKLIGLD